MNKLIYITIFSVSLLLSAACQKEYEKEYNWAYPISGDWTVNVKYGEETYGPVYIKTYNSSFGKDSIWIEDGGFWPFKAKAKSNTTSLTFETTSFLSLPGERYEDEVTIKNAKIINKDSIYFEAEFGSDPGTSYQYSGHRRVSYDEYMNH